MCARKERKEDVVEDGEEAENQPGTCSLARSAIDTRILEAFGCQRQISRLNLNSLELLHRRQLSHGFTTVHAAGMYSQLIN